jgi:hypothetical protein
MEHFVADILLSSTEGGDPRINIGEKTDGEGFGADTATWANGDGFLSVPNPPSSAGCAQAVVLPEGNTQRAVATRDNRFSAAAGDLAPGDRAIVSDSAAYVKLTRADNKVEIVSEDMSISVYGAGGTIEIVKGDYSITVSDSGIALRYGVGVLPITSLTLGPTGVDITGVLKVNNVAVIVP